MVISFLYENIKLIRNKIESYFFLFALDFAFFFSFSGKICYFYVNGYGWMLQMKTVRDRKTERENGTRLNDFHMSN